MSVSGDGNLKFESRRRILMHLQKFNKVVGPLSINNITYTKIKEFDRWLKTQNYLTNTIGSYHKDLKRTINALIREDEMKINPYTNFHIVNVKTRRTYLTAAEINRLTELNYSAKGMQATLDRFLISCGTGPPLFRLLHATQTAYLRERKRQRPCYRSREDEKSGISGEKSGISLFRWHC